MTAPVLRAYQTDIVTEFYRSVTAGQEKVLLVAPTAAGKTVIMAAIIARAVAKQKRVLVIAHRREIISLTSRKLHDREVRHGIIRAGDEKKLRPTAAVQVASIQTLHARAIRSSSIRMPLADLLIIDEAHHARAATYRKVIDAYPEATLLGLTATPCRGDGLGLGNLFDVMIECPQVAALVSQGYLVKSRVYAPVNPDLRGVRVKRGDYVEAQLAEHMDRPKLVGDIVSHWHRLGERRRTVAFACSVGHSIHIRDEFIRSGVRAEHLDGSTPNDERDAMLARLASGETEVISNCQVLTEGWDCPATACCILARPTRQMGLYRQMIGRVLRPAEGKRDAIILDHSGAVLRHGLPEDHVEWSLDVDHRAVAPAHQARLERKVPGLIECAQCSALRLGGKPCPSCGFLPRRSGQYVPHLEGELGLVTGGRARAPVYDRDTKRRWYGEFTAIARQLGKNPGWPYHLYLAKFGEKPDWNWRAFESPPTPEVRSYVRSRQIAYAKARGAA
jgi:DNA repair protein RadD